MSFLSKKKKAVIRELSEIESVEAELKEASGIITTMVLTGALCFLLFASVTALQIAQGYYEGPALLLWFTSSIASIILPLLSAKEVLRYIDIRAKLTSLQIAEDQKNQGT